MGASLPLNKYKIQFQNPIQRVVTLDGYFIIMISEKNAKLYCKDDISLIENYELAIKDTKQIWHCHHRGEILACGRYTQNDLKKFGLYWKRPACELIFMTISEHSKLHTIGKHHSEDTKKKISESIMGIHNTRRKPILQYTKEGDFINEWTSGREASIVLCINRGNITNCCQGKLKSAGGFVWSYKYI